MDRPEDGRRERLRKLGKIALSVAGGALLLYLGAGLLLRTLLDPDDLARWAEPRMEAAVGRDVELAGIDVSIFPGLAVELRELRVAGAANADSAEIASVDRLRLGIALLPLLRRRVQVDEAVAEGLDLRLRVDADGASNFGDFVPEGSPPADAPAASGAPISLEIRELRLAGGRLDYRDAQAGRRVEAEGLDGRVGLTREDAGWRLDARLEAEALRGEGVPGAQAWSGAPAALAFSGEAGPGGGWLRAESGAVRLGRVELALAGRVDSLTSPVRRLDLTLRADDLPVEDALAFARPGGGASGVEAAGTMDLDVALSGGLGDGRRPAVTGSASLRDGRYRSAAGETIAEGVEAEVELAEDSVVLRRLSGRLLGGPAEIRGTLRPGSGGPFTATLRAAPRLERLPGSGDRGTSATGTARLDLRLSGRMGAPASTRAQGTVGPEGVTLRREGWAGPVAVPGGTVRMDGDRATLSGLPIVVGGDTLRVDGRVLRVFSHLADPDARPELDLAVRGDRLDLGHLYPREEDGPGGPSYGQIALAQLGGRPLGGRPAAETAARRGLSRPGPPPAAGQVRLAVGELRHGPWRLSDVAGRLVLGEERVQVRDADFAVLGGRVGGAMSLGVGRGAREPFTLDLRAEEVAGAELLSRLTPLGSALSGPASLRLSVAGALDTLLLPVTEGLEGEGRLELAGGRIRENPVSAAISRRLSLPFLRSPSFDRMVLPFRVRGDSLTLPSAVLESDSLSARLDGVIGLGGDLDLSAGLELPRRILSSVPLPGGAAGETLRKLVAGGGAGGLTLGIRGTLAEPAVELGVAPGPGAVPGGLKKKAEEEIQERARGLLDRVMGGGREPAADSAARDTARRDSVPDGEG